MSFKRPGTLRNAALWVALTVGSPLAVQGEAIAEVVAGPIFSTTQSATQSYLRFFNTGTSAGAVTVTLRDYASGKSVGQWTSVPIPVNAERQYAIAEIESAVGLTGTRPQYYSLAVQSDIEGYFQHVLSRSSDGALTNVSTCAAGTGANRVKISAYQYGRRQ